MSYAYTDYHHHQFDRPFLSPLPMPSPKSCWYPQRQDVQFGYSYPSPEPDPPWLHQTTEYQQSTSYEPEMYSPPPSSQSPTCWEPLGQHTSHGYPTYDQPAPPAWPTTPPQHSPSSWCPPRRQSPPTCPLGFNDQDFATIGGDGRSESMDYPEEYWDAADSRRLSRPYLRHDLSRSYQLAAPVVPPPPLQHSPSCWISTSPTSHCRSAPLPAADAAPSLDLPPPAPPCSPNIIGDEGESLDGDPPLPTMMALSCSPNIRYDSIELIVDDRDESVKSCSSTTIDRLPNRDQVGVEEVLLDDEEDDGGLTASSPSPMCLKIQKLCFRARSEALECMPIGPDNCATAYISDVNALMIYCPRRLRLLGILGVHKVDVGAINALAKLRRVRTDIGSIDCRKVGATSLGNIASPLTSWLSVVIVFTDCRQYCVFDPGGLSNERAIMRIDEETFRWMLYFAITNDDEEVVDSESHIVVASNILISSGKVEAPLLDFLGRISEFGVLAKGLMNNGSKNCPRISQVDLFVMASSPTLLVASWFPP